MRDVDVQRIADGLWRWTAAPAGGEAAGSVYLELPAAVVLVDPVLPQAGDAGRERFWRALDRDVERMQRPVLVVETRAGSGPDAEALAARYAGSGRWQPGGGELPEGIAALPLDAEPASPVMLWIEGHRTLVTGRALAVGVDGALSLAADVEPSAGTVRALLALPVERVLPTLGPAVVHDGGVALARVLSRV